MELEHNLEQIRARGLGLAAISYDSVAVLRNFADRQHITFPLLSDPESKIIRAFGILNEAVPAGTQFYGIPHPGTYIVDLHGVVVAKYFEDDYRERYTASDILVRQYGADAGQSRTVVETPHLKLTASASSASARPGERIALVLDIELKPRMHVYAPGVEGYIPVEWKMAETDAIRVHPPDFPPAQRLRLEAIHETVPVFQNHLRVVRDVTFSQDAKLRPHAGANGEVTLEGTFRYQACDDRTCYTPFAVPLRWSFRFEPLDRQRVPAELQRKP